MLPNGYEEKTATKEKTLNDVKRVLQYDIIEDFQKKVARMNVEELKVYAKMNNIETF